MSPLDRVRARGEGAIEALRLRLSERAAALLNIHPEFARGAAEIGLVDRAWLEDPTRPVRTATSLDVVQRFLERSVEQEPSLIAHLGLNAIQLLTVDSEPPGSDATPIPATIVFTDLEGFTSFTAREGDAAARELLAHHHRAVGPVIRSRGGRLVKKIGDGLLMSFPASEAAVLATLEIAEDTGTDLRLRAGIHHGEVVQLGDDLIGHDVNVAARVTESAASGEILATTAVRSSLGKMPSGVVFGRARRRKFKGVEGSVLVCPVRRAG